MRPNEPVKGRRSFRSLKLEARRRLPVGHPFREAVLSFNDEVEMDDAEAAAMLRILVRLLQGKEG